MIQVTSSIGCFYFLVLQFLVVISVRQIKQTHVGFRAHLKIASRIVSYHIPINFTLGVWQSAHQVTRRHLQMRS